MKPIEELQREMKQLMDLEIIRMKIRHQELMLWLYPRIFLVAILVGLIVWFELRFT